MQPSPDQGMINTPILTTLDGEIILTPRGESKVLEILLHSLMECTIRPISIPTIFHPITDLPNTNTSQLHLLLGTLPLRIRCCPL
jgi:hypothetical protein